MFNKIKTGFRFLQNSPYFLPTTLSLVIGAASSAAAFFSNLTIFPIISGLFFIIFFVVVVLTQIELSEIKLKNTLEPDHFKIITENMKEAVIIYTPEFKITTFNPAAEKIFGIKEEEIKNQTISPGFMKNEKLKPLVQVIFPSLAPMVKQISESGWPQITEMSTENGLNLIAVFSKTVNKKQNSTSFIKIIQNKTKEKNISESKSIFTTNFTQQTQEPLKEIINIFKEAKEKIKKGSNLDIETINKGIQTSNLLIKTIKNLSEINKLEEGKYIYEFKEINLSDLVREITEKAKDVAESYGVSVSLSSIDKALSIVDPQKITAVISTLIDNAIKYNNNGGSVDVSLTNKDNFAEIIVSDTGIGIQKNELEKIFQKFYRTKEGIKTAPLGGGLGLYIAKKIIEKHKGNIWAESIPGRGSSFHLTLPIQN
jgi:PAS domain S-box-containing protein